MKKIAYYLIVGLAITALEAKTVEAQGADPTCRLQQVSLVDHLQLEDNSS